jgi:spermidine synthase
MIADSLPYWPINPLLAISPWHTFQLDMVRCLWAILPPAILWGASFPLALGGGGFAGRGPGAAGGWHLCRQYPGRHRGRAQCQPDLIPWIGTRNPSGCCWWSRP